MQEFDMTRQEEPPTPLSDGSGPFTRAQTRSRQAQTATAPAFQQSGYVRKKKAGCLSRFLLLLLIMAGAAAGGLYMYHRALEARMTPHLVRTLEGFEDGVWDLEYSPDGRYLAAGAGSSASYNQPVLRVWDAASGRVVIEPSYQSVSASLSSVQDMAFTPDSRNLAVLTGTEVWIAALDGGKEPRRITLTEGYTSMKELRFSPDGRHLAVLSDGIAVCSVETGRLLFRYTARLQETVDSYAFTADGGLLFSAYLSDTLRVWRWRPEGGEILFYTVIPSVYLPGRAAFSRSGRFASYANDTHVFLFDVTEPSLLWKRKGDFTIPRVYMFSPDDSLLYLQTARGGINIWNTPTGRKNIGVYIPMLAGSPFCTLSRDGRFLFLTDLDERAELWDLQRRRKLRSVTHIDDITQFSSEVYSAAISPDGRHFATGREKVRIWNIDRR